MTITIEHSARHLERQALLNKHLYISPLHKYTNNIPTEEKKITHGLTWKIKRKKKSTEFILTPTIIHFNCIWCYLWSTIIFWRILMKKKTSHDDYVSTLRYLLTNQTIELNLRTFFFFTFYKLLRKLIYFIFWCSWPFLHHKQCCHNNNMRWSSQQFSLCFDLLNNVKNLSRHFKKDDIHWCCDNSLTPGNPKWMSINFALWLKFHRRPRSVW